MHRSDVCLEQHKSKGGRGYAQYARRAAEIGLATVHRLVKFAGPSTISTGQLNTKAPRLISVPVANNRTG